MSDLNLNEQYFIDVNENINIKILDNENNIIGTCHMIAYSSKDKVGRLVLKEIFSLNFKTRLKVLLTGLSYNQGEKYQIIKELILDKHQELTLDKQITFTFNSVSDWERKINV